MRPGLPGKQTAKGAKVYAKGARVLIDQKTLAAFPQTFAPLALMLLNVDVCDRRMRCAYPAYLG
jgi:hypothetical protein